MFPIWDIPGFVYFFAQFKPLLVDFGTVVLWITTVVSIIVQLGVLVFGVMTINEHLQKAE